MKKFKVIALFIVLILAAGCTNKSLNENYDKMQIGKNKINGYILDLRIYGNNDGKRINEILRITNYKNTVYKVVKTITSSETSSRKEEITYIKNDKTYVADKNGNYIEGKSSIYSNPSLYLEGLNHISSIDEPTKETIGTIKYNMYGVEIKKGFIKTLLKDTILKNMEISSNIVAKVYIDKEGYVSRIIYELGTVTINANYYGINTVKKIDIPINSSDVTNENSAV